MFNCTTIEYDLLYAKWLGHPETLLELGEYAPGQKLLDLCGGTGILARTALTAFRSGKKSDVTVFDLRPRLEWWSETHERRHELCYVEGNAEEVDKYFTKSLFDLVVCRQAMGYLDINKAIPAIAKVTKPGGKFVFSVFDKPRRVGFRQYKHNGTHYREAHLFAFKRVFHLQWCVGRGTDLSIFRYHSEGALVAALSPWFDLWFSYAGRSIRFVCTRKEVTL